ncbi:MAG: hypothetical protein KDB90_01480 [Planctomycetes bacterium]|nr:hypothetical protein [Planctomycetota bacterium]
MASNKGTSVFARARGWIRAALGRIIRRGFFRIVLLLFLILFVVPFTILNVFANRSSANKIMHEVVGLVFNTTIADVTWDEERTVFTGPSITLTGSITYFDLKVTRKSGETAHPRGTPLKYDFLRIPKVQIDYDLKRLPDLPVTSVRLEQGLALYFNIHKGDWLDADMFQTGGAGGEVPVLPQIITQGTCDVKLRADGIFVAPETLTTGVDWYDMKVKGLSLLPSPNAADQFVIGGNLSSDRFGDFALGGSVGQRAQHVDVLFRTTKPIQIDRAYAAVLAEDVRNTVEQFQITAKTSIKEAKVEIEPGKELQFSADIEASQGSICFIGFPLAVSDVTADIKVRNNNIVVDAIGRRGAADVRVNAKVDAVGTNNELLQVSVDIRNLLVDEKFRLALLPARLQPDNLKDWNAGIPYTEEEWDPLTDTYYDEDKGKFVDGFPEWQGPAPWRGGTLYPDIDEVLPFICRAFTPMGLADFQLRLDQEMKGRDPITGKSHLDQDLDWKVFIHDATAAYVGLPEQKETAFPIPLHNAYGVVEGMTSPGKPSTYVVRGYTPEELAMLGMDTAGGFQASTKGLTGTLNSEGERLWVYAIFKESTTPGQKSSLKLNFESDGLDFNSDVKARMPQNIRDVVDQFAPSGKVDIQRATVEVQPEGDTDVVYDFTLSAKSVVAQYQFPDAEQPAKFREIAGTIRIEGKENRVELSSLRCKLLGSPVTLNLSFRDGDVPSFSVESDDFQLRPDFTSVLPRGLAATLKRFEPRGYVKFEVSGRRSGNEPDFTDVDVTFLAGTGDRSGSISFDRFPYTLTDVAGRLVVHMDEAWASIIIRDFSGRGSELPGQTDPSRITINGQVLVAVEPDETAAVDGEPPPDKAESPGPIVDLRIEATRVPVDSALMSAFTKMLQEPGATDKPALVDFVEKLKMGGTVGTSGRLVSDGDGNMDWQFEVMLEGASVNFENFPYPIEGLYGSVIIDHSQVSLRNVEGRAEDGRVTIHNASYSDLNGWSISCSARDLNFASPVLRRAMPGGLREVLKKLNPLGTFDIDLELSGKDEYMHYQVSLDIYETDLELGLHFDDMTARFDMEGVFEREQSRQNGTVFIKEVFFKDARFNDVTTAVQYFDDRVEFPNLRGRFYDGWLEGRFGMSKENYAGELEIRGADLRQLGKTAFPDAGDLLGALDAEIVFHSDYDKDGQIGRGRIDIQPFNRESDDPLLNSAKLLAVPLFSQIAAVTGNESNFDEGHVFFWLGSDRITIREMDFVSNAARVETFGTDEENYIMYGTSQMKMKLFFTLAPRSPVALPVVQWVLDKLKQILFPLFITGTLNKPDVQPFSLTAEQLEGEEFPRRPRGP